MGWVGDKERIKKGERNQGDTVREGNIIVVCPMLSLLWILLMAGDGYRVLHMMSLCTRSFYGHSVFFYIVGWAFSSNPCPFYSGPDDGTEEHRIRVDTASATPFLVVHPRRLTARRFSHPRARLMCISIEWRQHVASHNKIRRSDAQLEICNAPSMWCGSASRVHSMNHHHYCSKISSTRKKVPHTRNCYDILLMR